MILLPRPLTSRPLTGQGLTQLWTPAGGFDPRRAVLRDVGAIAGPGNCPSCGPCAGCRACDDCRRVKVSVERVVADEQAGSAVLEYRRICWAQWRGWLADRDPTALPLGLAGAHVVVVTRDEQVLLVRRSQHTGFYPGAWSAGIEEGMESCDTSVASVTARGLDEELAVHAHTHARLLGLARELDPDDRRPWGVAALAAVRLGIDAHELAQRRLGASDAYEASEVDFVGLDELARLAVEASGPGWHPTAAARLRLLAASDLGKCPPPRR